MNITRSILIIPLAGLLLTGCATHSMIQFFIVDGILKKLSLQRGF